MKTSSPQALADAALELPSCHRSAASDRTCGPPLRLGRDALPIAGRAHGVDHRSDVGAWSGRRIRAGRAGARSSSWVALGRQARQPEVASSWQSVGEDRFPTVVADMSSIDSVRSRLREIGQLTDALDVLVDNAGAIYPRANRKR